LFHKYLLNSVKYFDKKKIYKSVLELLKAGFIDECTKEYFILSSKPNSRYKKGVYLDNMQSYTTYKKEAVKYLYSATRNKVTTQAYIASILKIDRSTVSKICKDYEKVYIYEEVKKVKKKEAVKVVVEFKEYYKKNFRIKKVKDNYLVCKLVGSFLNVGLNDSGRDGANRILTFKTKTSFKDYHYCKGKNINLITNI